MATPGGTTPLPDFSGTYLTPPEEARRHELCQAAIRYAQRGWRVIPVWHVRPDGDCACRKGECLSPGKHAIYDRWQEVATCDPQAVAHWWRPSPEGAVIDAWYPRANIGLVTGAGSGIWVLDEDTYAGGEQQLGAYERRHGELPRTRIHHTPRGGQHWIWAHPGFPVRNSARKRLGAGLDVRGENGLIIAPPSLTADGAYEIASPAHDTDPAQAPGWLLALLREENERQAGETVPGTEPAAGTPWARRYVQAGVEAEAARLRAAPAGQRNNTLNEAAFSLGTLGGAELLDEGTAWQALSEAALAAGLGLEETRASFRSGWRAGIREPRQVQWNVIGEGGGWPQRPFTEFGNAERMVDHFADVLRWCPERRVWMVYRSGCWQPEFAETGLWYAQAMIRRLETTEATAYAEEPDVIEGEDPGPSPRQLFITWARKQHSRKAVTAAADLCRGLAPMRISITTFDADASLLNHRGGVTSLRTGEEAPHDPELRMTMQATGTRNPGAPRERWDRFLARVQPDPIMRAYLQRVMGYTASGEMGEQVMFLHHGEGANGKSVFHAVCSAVLGTYSQAVPVETLIASRSEGRVPNDVARMQGKRYLLASETKAGRHLDEQIVKQLTGGETIAARFMRAEFFEFQPTGKIHLTTNHLLRLTDDKATWRRLHLIPWSVTIPESEWDLRLAEKIIAEESAGVLDWITAGAMAWYSGRLGMPEPARAAKESYRREESFTERILEYFRVAEPAPGAVGRSSRELYAHYAFCEKQGGFRPVSIKAFVQNLKSAGFEYTSVHNHWRGFPGIEPRLDINIPLSASIWGILAAHRQITMIILRLALIGKESTLRTLGAGKVLYTCASIYSF
jgi:putative DNA primase/helicase